MRAVVCVIGMPLGCLIILLGMLVRRVTGWRPSPSNIRSKGFEVFGRIAAFAFYCGVATIVISAMALGLWLGKVL